MSKPKTIIWKLCVKRETTIFPAFGVTESFHRIKQVLMIPFRYSTVRFVDSKWWYPEHEYAVIKNIFATKAEKDVAYFFNVLKKQKQCGEDLKKYVRTLARRRFTQKEIATELKRYIERMHSFYAFWWIAIPAGEVLEERVKQILSAKGIRIPFEELIFVTEDLQVNKEWRELMHIGRTLRTRAFRKLSDVQGKKLEKHADAYGWLSTSYHVGAPLTANDFFEKLKKISPQKELAKIIREKRAKIKLLAVLRQKLSKQEFALVQAMQGMIFLRNYQKETVNECQFRSEVFLKRVAHYLGMDWEDFLRLSPYEALAGLRQGKLPNRKIVTARKKYSAIILDQGHCYISTAKKFTVSESRADEGAVVRGTVACVGAVKGKVRVVKNKSQLKDFRDGEILVTAMTTIDYVHAMKKAAAIVTDEGGITCHAAIFSREFNIPCIIGTKNATDVFRTGDVVVMNPDEGRVKRVTS